jgi:hypothetical protein
MSRTPPNASYVAPYDACNDYEVTGAVMGPNASNGTTAKSDSDLLKQEFPSDTSSTEVKRGTEDQLRFVDPPGGR